MWWEVLRLPPPPKNDSVDALSRWVDLEDDLAEDDDQEFEPNPTAEHKHLLFFPDIEGPLQLRRIWYMKRRGKPMVPAPENTPMPDKQPDSEG